MCQLKGVPKGKRYYAIGSQLGNDLEPWCPICLIKRDQFIANAKRQVSHV